MFDSLEGSSDLIGHQKLTMGVKNMADSDQVFFVKTHHLPSDNYPAIYLVRDGRDSLVSYTHYLISFRDNSLKSYWQRKIKTIFGWNEYTETLIDLIVSSDRNYGSWSENVKYWMGRDSNTCVIRFEELLKNPYEHIAKVMKAMNVQTNVLIKDSKIPSFEELNTKWPQFFRQGKSGNWRQDMTSEIQDLFWKYHGEVMEEIGYER